MKVLPAIEERHSVRSYEPRPLEPEALETVLQAARMAPTGQNARHVRLFVVQDPQVLAELNRLVIQAMTRGNTVGANRVPPEGYCFYYHAPALVFTAVPKEAYNAFSDTGCVLENAMLQAAELGLGSCWLNNLRRAQADPDLAAYLRSLGVREEEQITGGLALGYPAAAGKPNPRQDGNEIIRIG